MIWQAFEWLVTSVIAVIIAALICTAASMVVVVAREIWDVIRR